MHRQRISLRSAARSLALGLLASGAAAVVLLAAGVALMAQRGGTPGADPGDSEAGLAADMESFLRVARETILEARVQMPGAELYYVVLMPEGLYTFRFLDPATGEQLAIVTPRIDYPSFPVWELFINQYRPAPDPQPEVIDLAELLHTPVEVAAFFESETAMRLGVFLSSQNGELTWTAHNIALGATTDIDCAVSDASLDDYECEGLPPTP